MFSWDEGKNKINKKKHSISFELARSVFNDALHITLQDHSANEDPRWKTIGKTTNGLLCIVVYILNHLDEEDRIHIISARRVTRVEMQRYEATSEQESTQILGHSASPNRKGWFGPGGYRELKRDKKISE